MTGPLFSAAAPLTLSATAAPLTSTSTAQPLTPVAARSASPTASTKLGGFDESQPIAIQGHRVLYRQADETLLAEGDVALESNGTVVHADKLWYDLKQGTLRAEGEVVVSEGANTLWARRVVLQQLSRTG